MRVQLIKFLAGIVFVACFVSTVFTQDVEMVKPAPPNVVAAAPDLYQPPRPN